MRLFKYIAINIFLSFILILILLFLFKSGIIKNYIVGGPSKDFFIDLKLNFIPWLECYKLDLNFEVISIKTKLPVHIAEDPLRCVARGTGIALKNIAKFPFLILF